MTERVDFSANAPIYDRRHGVLLTLGEARRLFQAAVLRTGARVLDIGAGTGRIALPMSELGCDVVALEPSPGMVLELRGKALGASVSIALGEGAWLPFRTASFEGVVIARLLYLTADWREILGEVRRVLVPGGPLLHEWGNGQGDETWVRVREEARRLFESAGVSAPFHPGARSESEVERQLEKLGFACTGREALGSGPALTLREFLRQLSEGELSYIWAVPGNVRAECLPRLMRWAEQEFDLDESMATATEWCFYRGRVASAKRPGA